MSYAYYQKAENALYSGNKDLFEDQLDKLISPERYELFNAAIANHQLDFVDILVRYGKDDLVNESAVMKAIDANDPEIVEYLVENSVGLEINDLINYSQGTQFAHYFE